MADRSVIAVLESAVAADPGNPGLRVHLASPLLMSGDPGRGIDHAQAALAVCPDDPEALAVAADASRALGDASRADAYGRLLGSAAPARLVSEPAGDGHTEEPDVEIKEVWERPTVTLSDVGGLDAVKQHLQGSFLAPLRDPALRSQFHMSLRSGLLLYGPPGCGKTFLGRAIAGELEARFMSIGLNDVLDMWLGESERRLHEAFQAARRMAPCVLFFDEIDALGRRRSQLRQSAGRTVVNSCGPSWTGRALTTTGCSCWPRRTIPGMSTRHCAGAGTS